MVTGEAASGSVPEPLGPRAKRQGLSVRCGTLSGVVCTHLRGAHTECCVVPISRHNINTDFYTFLLWVSFFFLGFSTISAYSVSSLCRSLHMALMPI